MTPSSTEIGDTGRVLVSSASRDGGDAGVATITLARAAKRNALTPRMIADLHTAVRNCAASEATRVILLTGEGPALCAGFDLTLCEHDTSVLDALLRGLFDVTVAMRQAPQTVVIAAHGAAIAGGCALLAAADIVVASRTLKVGYPVVKLGISPAVSAGMLLPAIGSGAARTRLLDTQLVDAARAHALGLVHELANDDAACLARGVALARELASKPPHALRETKRWLNRLDATGDIQRQALARDTSLALVGSAEQRALLAQALTPTPTPGRPQ